MHSVVWRDHGKTFLETSHAVGRYHGQNRLPPAGFINCRSAVCFGLALIVILTVYLLGTGQDLSGVAKTHEIQIIRPLSVKANSHSQKVIQEDSNTETYKAKGDKCKSHLIGTLNDIFLVINFNHAFYENIPVLIDYYGDVFPNYAVCGPIRSKKYKVIRLNYPKGETGYYTYRCLSVAIKRNPGYKGYLFLNDDMIINWWNFLSLDKGKLWTGCYPSLENSNPVDKPAPNRWWKRAKTAERCSAAFHIVEASRRSKLMATYFANTKGKKICMNCWSDIFYIPRKYTDTFVWLSDTFYKKLVFLEVAVPMILFFLEDRRRLQVINGVYLPDIFGNERDYLEGGAAWKVYKRDLTYIHPYKLSGLNNTENVARFQDIVVAVSKEVLSTQCLDIVYMQNDKSDFLWNLDKS